jgi:hypothetical protein
MTVNLGGALHGVGPVLEISGAASSGPVSVSVSGSMRTPAATVGGCVSLAGAAGFVQGEERRPWDEVVVVDAAEQGDESLEGFEAGVLRGFQVWPGKPTKWPWRRKGPGGDGDGRSKGGSPPGCR